MGWKTSEEMGLSPKEIDAIVEKLWKEESSKKNCHDCGAAPGEEHEPGCDVPRCKVCGIQALQCDEHNSPEEWTGIWPGIQECYDNKWISYFTANGEWSFDLNRAAVERQRKLQSEPQPYKFSIVNLLTNHLNGKLVRADVLYYNNITCMDQNSKNELVRITGIDLFDEGGSAIYGIIEGGKNEGFKCRFPIKFNEKLNMVEE